MRISDWSSDVCSSDLGAATWLITQMDPDEPDILFGLCDLGLGFPELGSVRLSELESVEGPLGLGIERDLYFEARYPLSVYAEAARRADSIVTATRLPADAALRLGPPPDRSEEAHHYPPTPRNATP